LGSEFTEGGVRQDPGGRYSNSHSFYDALCHRLVEGSPAGISSGSHIGEVEHLEDVADCTIFTGCPVERRKDDAPRFEGGEGRKE
jgi:hypothetical protein